MLSGSPLPNNLVVFGILAGVFTAIGLIGIPGICAGVDSMVSMPWYLDGVFFGWTGIFILYPVWMIWFGGILLSR